MKIEINGEGFRFYCGMQSTDIEFPNSASDANNFNNFLTISGTSPTNNEVVVLSNSGQNKLKMSDIDYITFPNPYDDQEDAIWNNQGTPFYVGYEKVNGIFGHVQFEKEIELKNLFSVIVPIDESCKGILYEMSGMIENNLVGFLYFENKDDRDLISFLDDNGWLDDGGIFFEDLIRNGYIDEPDFDRFNSSIKNLWGDFHAADPTKLKDYYYPIITSDQNLESIEFETRVDDNNG